MNRRIKVYFYGDGKNIFEFTFCKINGTLRYSTIQAFHIVDHIDMNFDMNTDRASVMRNDIHLKGKKY